MKPSEAQRLPRLPQGSTSLERSSWRYCVSSDRDCGLRRGSSRCPERAGFLEEHHERPLQHHARSRPTAGIRRCTTIPTTARRTRLLQDRRLGARVRMGSRRSGACHSAAGGRRHGRFAEVGASPVTREALVDYGYPERPLNTERTAVILGNAMGGERHYSTVLRATFPEYARELDESAVSPRFPRPCGAISARELTQRIGALPGDHRRQHARRTGELRRRPGRECLQFPRPQLRL